MKHFAYIDFLQRLVVLLFDDLPSYAIAIDTVRQTTQKAYLAVSQKEQCHSHQET